MNNQCQTVEFQDEMANIDEVSHVEQNGSSTWKDINLLVILEILTGIIVIISPNF